MSSQDHLSASAQARKPERTCLGCRSRAHQGDLLRVVLVDGRLTADPRREHFGRGAYVHPTGECVTAAGARGAFRRALRAGGPLDPSDLVEFCATKYEPRVGSVGDDSPMNSQR